MISHLPSTVLGLNQPETLGDAERAANQQPQPYFEDDGTLRHCGIVQAESFCASCGKGYGI
ncbi:MAG: hypothetical protein JG718_17425 [Candidatus Thiothrix moscowensis]|nr:hypothetical protein [Candidatus Thiothrix moscowensis]